MHHIINPSLLIVATLCVVISFIFKDNASKPPPLNKKNIINILLHIKYFNIKYITFNLLFKI